MVSAPGALSGGEPTRSGAGLGCCWPTLIQATMFLLRPAGTYQALAIEVPTSGPGPDLGDLRRGPLLLAVPVGRMVNGLGERRLMVAGSPGPSIFQLIPNDVFLYTRVQ